ncbi:MAG: AAA family ATPase [Bacteroidota bacterium]
MENSTAPNYWIFQAHTKGIRLKDALQAEQLKSFTVRAHHQKMTPGDKVIIWKTGKNKGCYALATLTSSVDQTVIADQERPFFLKLPSTKDRVQLRVDYNLWNKPITPDLLSPSSVFDHFNVGLPGLNYEATAAQYQALVNLVRRYEAVHEPAEAYANRKPGRHPLNLILYGPPGTGKTFQTLNHALAILEGRSLAELALEERPRLRERYLGYQEEGRIRFLSFHQSYAYEDFVEGIKAQTTDGQINYVIEDGLFKQICQAAAAQPDRPYVLIIDEINRGNIASIFGELITLIEADKRLGRPEAIQLQLPYSKSAFSVPANLHLIATLNTADRSVETLDVALRRRFTFYEVAPQPAVIGRVAEQPVLVGIDLERLLLHINQRIEVLLSRDYCIGHSYFLHISTLDELRQLFLEKIIPLLQEYFYSDYARIGLILGRDFVTEQARPTDGLFADFEHEYLNELADKKLYRLRPVEELDAAAFIRVYTKDYE